MQQTRKVVAGWCMGLVKRNRHDLTVLGAQKTAKGGPRDVDIYAGDLGGFSLTCLGSQAAQAAILTANGGTNSPKQSCGVVDQASNLDVYRHSANISLHSSMQSNVPEPYSSENQAPIHLAMPMGGEVQRQKFLSGQRMKGHATNGDGTAMSQD